MNKWYQKENSTVTKLTAYKKLQTNTAEDIGLLKVLNNIFIHRRKYIFKIPPPGKPVIALMSGGMDTTVIIAMLMEKYKLEVYPLYVNRKLYNSIKVKQSINKLDYYFRLKFPKLYHAPMIINEQIPPRELKIPQRLKKDDLIFNSYWGTSNKYGFERIVDKLGHRQGIPMQPTIYASLGMFYSQWLYETRGVLTKTIIGACLPSNTDLYQYETLTAHRLVMLNMCMQNQDFSWQYTSLPLEIELGYYSDKDEIVRWGTKYKVPLEQTWTCWLSKRYQCGLCLLCNVRKSAFQAAKVKDKIIYMTDTLSYKISSKIKRRLNVIFRYLKKLLFYY